MSASFLDYFSEVKDPRIERCKRHTLLDILFLSVSAVLAGRKAGKRLRTLVTFGWIG